MDLTEADLNQFTGTENWYRYPLLPRIHYTDGVKYVGEHGEAYWLIDKIATLQLEEPMRSSEFQVWTLDVAKERAVLVCKTGDKELHREEITFTDFPLAHIELWFLDNVICLPSEH